MRKNYDRECVIAELDMYCNDLYKNKKLNKDILDTIKRYFKKYPDLKEEFPILVKQIKKI